MEVKRAATAGFCMGVSLALHKLDTALRKNGQDGRPARRICTFGPIIHNPQVLRDYEEKGVACLHDPAEARSGDSVVIRAHGIPQDEEARLKACGATLMDATIFEEIRTRLAARLPNLQVLSTICDATGERQAEARSLAGQVDAMVIVGGRQSGNTRRLAALASEAGVATYHVETADELAEEFFRGVRTVGLTAGASTPKALIDAAEDRLRGMA